MRLMSSAAVLLFAAAMASGAVAQTPDFDAARISNDIKVLSDDSFEGRGIATIIGMVQMTRLDCAVSSAGLMRAALWVTGNRY